MCVFLIDLSKISDSLFMPGRIISSITNFNQDPLSVIFNLERKNCDGRLGKTL